jgi:hypothetical protein
VRTHKNRKHKDLEIMTVKWKKKWEKKVMVRWIYFIYRQQFTPDDPFEGNPTEKEPRTSVGPMLLTSRKTNLRH